MFNDIILLYISTRNKLTSAKMKESFSPENGGLELGSVNKGFEPDGDTFHHSNGVPNGLSNGIPTIEKIMSEKQNEKDSVSKNGDEEDGTNPDRQQWGNSVEFVMSCIAMSVGLGNVWRFPSTAYNNGGGAFLIPYLIILFVIGKPFYYMEMGLGQFSSFGPVKIWNMIPGFRGIGYGQTFATACVLTYYCSLMALTGFYFVNSFSAELPWAVCRDEWPNCVPAYKSENSTFNFTNAQSSSELYFIRYVLNELDNINDGIGIPDWRLMLCLLFSWLCILGVVLKGVSSSGKAAYFLALFPYVIMITLLIQGCTLPGAGTGILYFITPKWEKLLEANVWYAAVTQCFFSLNVGFGTLIMYSSYNNFRENIHRDALIVTTLDTCTSLIAGCTIFSILGNLAYELDADVDAVVRGGTGLAFISYPDAIAKFEAVPQLFAVLFFLMLFVLGVGSGVALVNAIITMIKDQFPHIKHWIVVIGACASGFLIGLIYVTPGGLFLLDLVDFYGATFVVFVLAVFEICGVAWIYGLNNFCDDLEYMQGHKVGIYWRICWGFVTPVLLGVVLIYFFVSMAPIQYNGVYYPDSAYAAGWVLVAFGVLQLPFWLGAKLIRKRKLGFKQMVLAAFTANERWGPQIPKFNREWREFKEKKRQENEAVSQIETKFQKVIRKCFGIIFKRVRQQLETTNDSSKYM